MPGGPPGGPADAAGDFAGSFTSPSRPLASCASAWSPADVATWVVEVLHLPQYGEVFEACGIDGPTLLELPEELLESELHITNPIHRKKIIAHAKLLGGFQEPTPSSWRSTPRGRRSTPRSGPSSTPSTWTGQGAAARSALACDDQCGASDEDILSSAGAASLQRAGIASGASSNGTGGIPGSSAASSNLNGSLLPRKDSVVSSNFSGHGNALADRAAARRGRSMDRLAMLQRNQTLSPRSNGLTSTPRRPPGSQATSPTGTAGSLRSVGASSRLSGQQPRRRQGSRGPGDGKAIAASGKRIDAWGELSPSTSRKGTFGKMPEHAGYASRDYGPLASPLSARRDTPDPTMSYYYKATFHRSPQSAVISQSRRLSTELGPKSCSPGPAYRPRVEWAKLRVGGTIGAAERFAYHRPNCNHWLSEVSDD